MNIFEITLDVDKRSNKESVNLRQGDINGTTIRATLRDHDVPMEGGEYTAMFCMTLPDRKTFYHDDATYENGVVTVVVKEQYAATVPGTTNNAYFELYDGEELKYTTASFMVRVKPSAMDGEAAQSYDPRVEALMTQMSELIETVTEAEAGRVEAENARVTAEQGRVDTFAANEATRDETFTANEGRRAAAYAETESARSQRFLANEESRQTAYEEDAAAWEAAENERANTFEENETERQSTFEGNEAERKATFDAFASPTVSVEETATGQIAHITWKDPNGIHVSDMVIDDAVNVTMTGDMLAVPVDPQGACVSSGTAYFYFSGWVGDRMMPCEAKVTASVDARFSVRITNATAREQGVIRVDYTEGTTYSPQADVCTISLSCGGRTFLHRLTAVAPRGGSAAGAYSHDSFEAFKDALVDALGLSVTETWNETAQRYDYQIVSGA